MFKRNVTTRVAAPAPALPWPDGVIARYLTVARATVDLIHDKAQQGDGTFTVATCTGCKAAERSTWATGIHGTHGYYTIQDRARGDRDARKWAQSHAETCRALPNPSGPGADSPTWRCPDCDTYNTNNSTTCMVCDHTK